MPVVSHGKYRLKTREELFKSSCDSVFFMYMQYEYVLNIISIKEHRIENM